MIRQRKRKSGRCLNIEILVAKLIEKSRFWQKHDIVILFVRSFCTWHFLENMFERCSFWRKCLMKKCQKIEKIKNVNFDMKIKNRITTRYCFCSIDTFWYPSNHFFGFLKLYFFGIVLVYFWYISRAEFLPPTVSKKPKLAAYNLGAGLDASRLQPCIFKQCPRYFSFTCQRGMQNA